MRNSAHPIRGPANACASIRDNAHHAHPIRAPGNASASVRIGIRVRTSLSVRALLVRALSVHALSVRAHICLSVRALSVCAGARVRACLGVRARARASVFCSNNAHVRQRASIKCGCGCGPLVDYIDCMTTFVFVICIYKRLIIINIFD